jgi:hypothetical protein
MNASDTFDRSRRQWEALAKARLRKGEPGSALESEFVKEGLAPQIAKDVVEEAIRSARACAIGLLIGSASFAALGVFVTVASYSATTSTPYGGTYLIWFGPVVCGGIVALVALARLMNIRR